MYLGKMERVKGRVRYSISERDASMAEHLEIIVKYCIQKIVQDKLLQKYKIAYKL